MTDPIKVILKETQSKPFYNVNIDCYANILNEIYQLKTKISDNNECIVSNIGERSIQVYKELSELKQSIIINPDPVLTLVENHASILANCISQLKNLTELCNTIGQNVIDIKHKLSQYDIDCEISDDEAVDS